MTVRPEANNRALASNHCEEQFEPDERHDPKGRKRNDEKNLTKCPIREAAVCQ